MKEFVLALVFDENYENLLLMRRKKEPYTGLLNGIGGKIDNGETPHEAVKREFYEETNFDEIDLDLLVTMVFENEHLHVFSGSMPLQDIIIKENHEGVYDWYEIDDSFFDCMNNDLAGGGNLPYFIRFAIDTKNGI